MRPMLPWRESHSDCGWMVGGGSGQEEELFLLNVPSVGVKPRTAVAILLP